MVWATSQAAPLRSVIADSITFSDGDGWSSGGYAANIRVNALRYGTQQQTFLRNAEWSALDGLPSFSTVAMGTIPTLVDRCDGATSIMGLAEVPLIAEKPYLFFDNGRGFLLAIPPLRQRVVGYNGGHVAEDDQLEVPLRDTARVYVATEADDAKVINTHLHAGRHVILSPGMYNVSEPLVVGAVEGQVLLGLGFATITPTRGTAAVRVLSAGARLAGVMVQAGSTYSPVLVQIGGARDETPRSSSSSSIGKSSRSWSAAEYASNPIVVHDIFVRVYAERTAPRQAQAGTMIHVAADHTVLDHAWLWRADHDGEHHFRRLENPVDHALVVDGENVIVMALFAEHCLDDLLVWRGEDGRLFFYQSELAYDAHPGPRIAGKVGYNVTARRHSAAAVGVYSFFFDNVTVPTAIVARNTSGFRHVFTHFLDGNGTIQSVINGQGAPVAAPGQSSYVCTPRL